VKRVLILGVGALARRLAIEIDRRPRCGHTVLGFWDEGAPAGILAGRRVFGESGDLRDFLQRLSPDVVAVAPADERDPRFMRTLMEASLRGFRLQRGEDLYEEVTGTIALDALTPSSVIFSRELARRRADSALTRVLSVTLAAFGLVVTSPLLAVIAVAIRLDSAGPAIFSQERMGRRGRPFRMWKFRTMHPVDRAASEWALDNRHRITRVGGWLRKFRLDELPQLVNVLRGDMDVVGPRPHPACNYVLLSTVMRNVPEGGIDIPCYALRSLVRPGLTGWAQIRYGYANDVNEEVEKLAYDLYYVKHKSLRLDLWIVAVTLGLVCAGRKSDMERASSDRRERSRAA
jgi:lipopolysaccharide/colanic/teichoic acid biosynthesis glycosyltransferase